MPMTTTVDIASRNTLHLNLSGQHMLGAKAVTIANHPPNILLCLSSHPNILLCLSSHPHTLCLKSHHMATLTMHTASLQLHHHNTLGNQTMQGNEVLAMVNLQHSRSRYLNSNTASPLLHNPTTPGNQIMLENEALAIVKLQHTQNHYLNSTTMTQILIMTITDLPTDIQIRTPRNQILKRR
jgi:hypothetical protein